MLLILVLLVTCLRCSEGVNATERHTIKVVFFLPGMEFNFLTPGLVVAIWKVKEMELLPDFDIVYRIGNSMCSPRLGMKVAVDLWKDMSKYHAVIGDSCSGVCQPLALLAAAWNVPTVSNLCTSDELSNTDIYPTFSRVVGVYRHLQPLLPKILETFHWTRVGIITSTIDLHHSLAVATRSQLEEEGKLVFYYAVESVVHEGQILRDNMEKLVSVIRDVKKNVRVVVIMQYPTDTRVTLAAAYEQGMYDGNYTFIGLEANADDADETIYRADIPRDVLWQGWIYIREAVTFPDNFASFENDSIVAARSLGPEYDNVKKQHIGLYTGLSLFMMTTKLL